MTQKTWDYIREHAGEDVRRLALQGAKDSDVDMIFALEQIAGRQMARTKLPSWAAIDDIIYPPHLSMEQCSSESTAKYKAALAGRGNLFVDLTGGLGVDFSFIARGFEKAIYVERQQSLCDIVRQNLDTLGLVQSEVRNVDGMDFFHTVDHADLVFVDPARRNGHGGRTFGIADCTPNVLEMIDELTAKADRVMLKLSPMLDWQNAVKDLGCVNEVHIVSVDNECKELLLIASKEVCPLHIFCVNNDNVFDFTLSEADLISTPQSLSSYSYLLEPNASIMKAGCFALIEARFGIRQLDANSHLFVSADEMVDFPGRQFRIEQTSTLNKRELKHALEGITHANIAVRNFPLSVADLRKRLKLKDGGDVFIFATTTAKEGHQLFICRKIS